MKVPFLDLSLQHRALREPAFLARLSTHFGGRLGRFLSASARSAAE